MKVLKDDCDFAEVISALKNGYAAQRQGWNGKNMYIYLKRYVPGYDPDYEPVICMFTAQQKHQPGWLASQPDMLAEDWSILDGNKGPPNH